MSLTNIPRQLAVSRRPIVTSIASRADFLNLVQTENPGVVIIKLGAPWCPPCRRINSLVHKCFDTILATQPNVVCCDLNVDENGDVYAFLKSKRMVSGIPSILGYIRKENHPNNADGFVPSDSVTGANQDAIVDFFTHILR